MTPVKVCACGIVFMKLPENAKHFLPEGDHPSNKFCQGYYFNCSCGSTHFVPDFPVPLKQEEQVA